MKQKLTWITINEWYKDIDILLIKKLIEVYNYDINIITNNNNINKFYKHNGLDVINLGLEDIDVNSKKLDDFLLKYGFSNPNKTLWQRELKIIGCNKQYLEKSALDYFVFFENYFREFDGVFFHNGDHYFHLIGEKVAKFFKIKVVYHNSIGVFPNQMVFSDSWKYNDFLIEKYLNYNITNEEKQDIEIFIKDKINKKPLIGGRRKLIGYFHIFKLFFYIKNYLLIGKYRRDYRFPLFFIKNIIFRIYNIYINKINYDSIKLISNKSIFFPMHVPDDAQTTTREFNFIDQLDLVKKILKLIPSGNNLIIKEHPHGKGMLNMKLFSILKEEFKNLIILSPNENTYEIVKKVSNILTVNSDVGYESIIIGKKPLTLGNSFYSGYGFDIKIDIENISREEFKCILEENDFNINIDERIKLIYSLKKVHKNTIFFKNSKLEFNLDKNSIDSISYNIDNYINIALK